MGQECSLSVFENRVLKRICGPKRDEVTGKWRTLHNELFDPYSYYFGDKIEKNEMGGARSTYGARRSADKVLVGRLEGKRSLERPRCRWGII
jgi:hypothetical protein